MLIISLRFKNPRINKGHFDIKSFILDKIKKERPISENEYLKDFFSLRRLIATTDTVI